MKICAGLFAPCTNPPNPARRIEDPEDKGPPVELCDACADGTDDLLARVVAQGKMEQFAFEIEAAERATSSTRWQA